MYRNRTSDFAHAPTYFDNAATTFPKPIAVREAVREAIAKFGGNPGRGGHPLAQATGELIYHARETAAAFFDAQPENVVFTSNCTHALNLALWGLLRSGDHVIISNLEHNSVLRPLAAMAKENRITYSIAEVSPHPAETVAAFRRLIQPRTKAIVCTLVSNVSGQILPWRAIGALCREYGIVFIADGAQACGIMPISLSDGISVLCTAGHKGLYGIMGSGLMVTDGTVRLSPLMQGGTGSLSMSPEMPDFLPDALEAGTISVPAIASLDAGIQFIKAKTPQQIAEHETNLCKHLMEGLRDCGRATIYRNAQAEYAPLVSFSIDAETPSDTAARLADAGFCVRAGLHCAPLAHASLGTTREGTVRFAPSMFNSMREVDAFLRVLTAHA